MTLSHLRFTALVRLAGTAGPAWLSKGNAVLSSQEKTMWGIVGLLLVVGIGFAGYCYLQIAHPWQLFRQETQAAQRLLDSRVLCSPPPAGVSEHPWIDATGFLWTAYVNIFFSPHSTDMDEMRRFRLDLQQYLDTVNSVDVETLRWIWLRLGKSGGRSEAYIKRHTCFFEDRVAAVERSMKYPTPP
jgi:hypothetical protein